MPDATRTVTQRRAEIICKYAKKFHMKNEGQTLEKLTLSLGVASFPENGVTSGELLKAADAALFCAKHEGRNRVSVAMGETVV
jgi:diguanylate cyclase (GGDEF)-like protein